MSCTSIRSTPTAPTGLKAATDMAPAWLIDSPIADGSPSISRRGALPGRETVQLYVGDEVTQDVVRPVKELKAFQKVELAPGETQI
ncbi:MAG: fibronectin type III-like domain-contianing protein, partial [Nitrosomonadales bacterium]|nr:fibronectin type III-like domain-contianing protein [Nitrosomonadales bacterium]